MQDSRQEPLVAVIATGGTIASTRRQDGVSVPALPGEALLALLPGMAVRLRPVELMAKDSSSLTLADMQAISDAVKAQHDDPQVSGVVVLHGTDTMEETALLTHVQHGFEKPVVFTGAQFTADHPQADGPANLAAAVNAAMAAGNGARGVLVAFGGRLLPAWGLYKKCSDSADAFAFALSTENPASPRLSGPVCGRRVDMVAVYPGCDGTQIEASLAAGAEGLVLAALGSGNANEAMVRAVALCAQRGVPAVLSSRVPEGRLAASYGGGGGGHDLVKAGAILSPVLRPGQARMLLAALIASGVSHGKITRLFSGDAG